MAAVVVAVVAVKVVVLVVMKITNKIIIVLSPIRNYFYPLCNFTNCLKIISKQTSKRLLPMRKSRRNSVFIACVFHTHQSKYCAQ